ncbi:unnamed protein product [Caenorhabditis auriculariae]|uniref:Uridine phosphorylase n=1 Tax=Caenorhabditis auriculariae TaxID=2777116 RepID=A0A8S1GWC6_9PELO|nr:unnamed protein product [Caenorhabditis auriculariae]
MATREEGRRLYRRPRRPAKKSVGKQFRSRRPPLDSSSLSATLPSDTSFIRPFFSSFLKVFKTTTTTTYPKCAIDRVGDASAISLIWVGGWLTICTRVVEGNLRPTHRTRPLRVAASCVDTFDKTDSTSSVGTTTTLSSFTPPPKDHSWEEMCDPNTLMRMFAAAAAQQQLEQQRPPVAPAVAPTSSATANAMATAQFNALAAAATAATRGPQANGGVTPEMMLWQSMLQAQLFQQLQQQQQQQIQQRQLQEQQQQPSFDDVLRKLSEQAKNGTNGHVRIDPKAVATPKKKPQLTNEAQLAAIRVAAAAAASNNGLEPGEVRKPKESVKPAGKTNPVAPNNAVMRSMLDAAMWQLLAAQVVQNGVPPVVAKKQPPATPTRANGSTRAKKSLPAELSVSTTPLEGSSRGGSVTPSENGHEGVGAGGGRNKRPPATEEQARVALEKGWRRQTFVRVITASGIRGDVFYFAPCGKKLNTYAEVMRYLLKNNIRDVTRDNFSFSGKLVVGEFIVKKSKDDGDEPEKDFVQMTEEEIHEELAKFVSQKVQKAAQPSPSDSSTAPEKAETSRKSPSPPPTVVEEILENLNDDMEDVGPSTSGHEEEETRSNRVMTREPMDDLLVAEFRPLPELSRIGNQCLDSNGFADALMVHEFVQNFAHVLNIDLGKVPKIEQLCAGLVGDERHLSSVLELTRIIFRLTLEFPGLPNGKRGKTAFGQGVGEIGLNRSNFSELMRIFLASRDSQGKTLSLLLDESSFESLGGTEKASILAYLCNELLCCQNIVKEIDGNLEEISRLKGEKWMREGKARTLRAVQKKKRKLTAKEEDEEKQNYGGGASDSDNSRPSSPANQKKFTPGLGQCEVLTQQEEDLTIEEMESLISELGVEANQLRGKIHDVSVRVRSFPFGWDRYHRQYWLLAHTDMVMVESIESAGPHNPACNAPEICAKDPLSFSAGDDFIDPDVIGCVEDLVDEVILTRANADKKTRRRYRRIDNAFKRGWWSISSMEALEHLKTSLHGRGIRERCLHRLLCKNWFLSDLKFGTMSLEPVTSTATRDVIDKRDRSRIAKMVERLRRRIVHSSVARPANSIAATISATSRSEGFGPPPTTTTTEDVDWAFEDVQDAEDVADDELRSRILQTEMMVEPRFFRFAFRDCTTVKVEGSAEPQPVECKIDDCASEKSLVIDEETMEVDEKPTSASFCGYAVPLSQKWKDFVTHEARTNAQLVTALQMLESSIAWERSSREALCQICKSPDGDEMLLCDGCETGFHMECFKPPMTAVPEGDWFCSLCLEERTGHKFCVLCSNDAPPLTSCQHCFNSFHLDCTEDQLDGPQYVCTHCLDVKTQNFERKVIIRGESEERMDPEENGDLDGKLGNDKRAVKRKAGESAPLVLPIEMNVELCRTMLDEIEQQPDSAPFMEPVNFKAVPSYREVISNPIDLSTIRDRVDARFYDLPEDFAADMELLFRNCKTFNEDDSPVGLAGINLSKFYHKRWRQHRERQHGGVKQKWSKGKMNGSLPNGNVNGVVHNHDELRPTNKYLESAEEDFLYHFGFGVKTIDIPALFGDTKFVCTGGSPGRFKLYAEWFSKESGLPCSENLSKSDRFVIYKTGQVCWINHGMGTPSLSIMLVETLKLMHHAKAKDVKFIRLGTSGGVGVEPGTVVVSTGAVNAELTDKYIQVIAGKRIERDTYLDETLRLKLLGIGKEMNIPVEQGKTLCADDFYEGQMRLDGFFCDYKPEEKFAFLNQLYTLGVRNIEMESTCFASMTYRAGVQAAIVCVTLLNRMNGDQVKIEKEQYIEYEQRPFRLVTALIRRELGI